MMQRCRMQPKANCLVKRETLEFFHIAPQNRFFSFYGFGVPCLRRLFDHSLRPGSISRLNRDYFSTKTSPQHFRDFLPYRGHRSQSHLAIWNEARRLRRGQKWITQKTSGAVYVLPRRC
jgi:hypothetical protein